MAGFGDGRLKLVQDMLRSAALLFLIMGALGARAAAAQDACTAPSAECAVVGSWEISASFGAGSRSNPVAGKSDIPLVVIPHLSYYGKRFFVENLEAGYTLLESDSSSLSLIAAPGYDRVFFHRHDLQNIFVPGGTVLNGPTGAVVVPASGQAFPVGSRHTTWLAGPEWTFGIGAISGQLNALREFTGRHEGYEVRGGLAAPLLRKKGSLVASAGFTWKSEEVVRYYYGVDRLYEPGSAFNSFVKLSYTLPLSHRWTFNAFANYERLASAIADSPIVTEDHVTTAFAGVVLRIH
jgi:outer membrane protein